MAKEYTSIRVSQSAKESAAEAKQETETWDDYIQRCSNNPPETREFVEAGALETPGLSEGADMDTEQLADVIRAELNTDAPNYDDVVQACRKAIREELPTERM